MPQLGLLTSFMETTHKVTGACWLGNPGRTPHFWEHSAQMRGSGASWCPGCTASAPGHLFAPLFPHFWLQLTNSGALGCSHCSGFSAFAAVIPAWYCTAYMCHDTYMDLFAYLCMSCHHFPVLSCPLRKEDPIKLAETFMLPRRRTKMPALS